MRNLYTTKYKKKEIRNLIYLLKKRKMIDFKRKILEDKKTVGKEAGKRAADILRRTIEEKGEAAFVAATGSSQFEFLETLTQEPGIDWTNTTMFHLDEYVGLSEDHPASFRKYLRKRLIEKVNPGTVHLIHGDVQNPEEECDRLDEIIKGKKIDVAFVGIGENGHLAFNDPPADFETERPFIVVELDEKCRNQQVEEGWFEKLEEVPKKAITMSIRQIMKARKIVCTVPERRKAEAVKTCLEGDITPENPASILRKHDKVYFYLDENSASLLED